MKSVRPTQLPTHLAENGASGLVVVLLQGLHHLPVLHLSKDVGWTRLPLHHLLELLKAGAETHGLVKRIAGLPFLEKYCSKSLTSFGDKTFLTCRL